MYTSKIYSFISAEISESESIQEKWKTLVTDNNENFNIISSLFDEVLSKYLKMIGECNQRFVAEKEKAHLHDLFSNKTCRKRANHVVQKKHGLLKSVFQITQLSTHRYRQSLFESDHSFSIGSLLQKRYLVLLCKAYGIQSSKFKTIHCLIS